MATGGLLYHHLRPRPPLHLAESHYALCRRFALKGLYFVPRRCSTNSPKLGFLHPTLRSIQCLKQEEQAGSDGEAVEWVNKAPQDPMVEFDPVTVFRRIVAERWSASSAMARAKETEANVVSQSTSPPPFSLGPGWRGKPTFAIIIALLLLAVAGALYSLRSKTGNKDATKPASADAKDTLKTPGYDRRKLGEDTIKAPDSVLTAMAIGAASVSRPMNATEPTSADAKDSPRVPGFDRQKLGEDTIKASDSVLTAMTIGAASVSGPKAPGYDRRKLGEDTSKAPDSILTAMAIGDASVSRPEDATEPTSADAQDTLKAPGYDRQKLGEDAIKAPDSVLTAMAIGDASVSRPEDANKPTPADAKDTVKAPGYDRRKLGENAIKAPDSYDRGKLGENTIKAPDSYDRRKLGENTIKAPDSTLTAMAIGAASVSRPKETTEPVSADAKDTLKAPIYDRQKLGEATIKAPKSIPTTMAIGDASVSRPKGHVSSSQDSLHPPNGNVEESQRPETATDFHPVVSAVAVEDMESDLHGKPMYGQMPSSSSNLEGATPIGAQNVGIEVTEGPWFGQGVDETGMLTSAELPELQIEKAYGLVESQAVPLIDKNTELGAETLDLTENMDGEFDGEVVAVSKQPKHSNGQVLDLKSEKAQNDGVLAERSVTAEELEHITDEEDSITSRKGNGVAEDTVCPEPNIVLEASALGLSNGKLNETDSGSDDDNNDNTEHCGAKQSFTLDLDDGVTLLQNSGTKNSFGDVQVAEGFLSSPSLGSVIPEGQENVTGFLTDVGHTSEGSKTKSDDVVEGIESEPDDVVDGVSLSAASVIPEGQESVTNLLSNVGHTSEGIKPEPDDVLDGLSSHASSYRMGQVEDGGFIFDPRTESLRDDLTASGEDAREESKKALEAAVPALAIGVGTVGALFGVAGGLQVVGFAALASVFSHDFLWAQSREALWQELNGITDRQKLLDFLEKRNIMRTESGNSSL